MGIQMSSLESLSSFSCVRVQDAHLGASQVCWTSAVPRWTKRGPGGYSGGGRVPGDALVQMWEARG